MKTMIHISFNGREVAGGPHAILERAGCGPDVAKIEDLDFLNQTFVEIDLEESDPRVAMLFQLLEQHGYPHAPYCIRGYVYTEEERQFARLLIVGAIVERYAFGGHGFAETTYDLSNACPNCGTGARQTSPLFIDAADVKKIKPYGATSTCYNDLFVKEKVLARLEKAGITDFSTRDVYSRRKNGETTQLPRKQIIPNHILSPMHPSTPLERKRLCTVCHRAGFESADGVPFRFVYRARDVAEVADFNFTWEWFGMAKFNSSLTLRFAHPCILVTPKVMNILREKEGEGALSFTPIHIVED